MEEEEEDEEAQDASDEMLADGGGDAEKDAADAGDAGTGEGEGEADAAAKAICGEGDLNGVPPREGDARTGGLAEACGRLFRLDGVLALGVAPLVGSPSRLTRSRCFRTGPSE